MPDVTIRIDRETRDRLARLARVCGGMSMKRLLDLVSRNVLWDDVLRWHSAEVVRDTRP